MFYNGYDDRLLSWSFTLDVSSDILNTNSWMIKINIQNYSLSLQICEVSIMIIVELNDNTYFLQLYLYYHMGCRPD